MGLLDNPQDAAMMQLGLGLLSAGGPSRMPVSFGQALGSAGNQAMDAYRQAQQANAQEEQRKAIAQMRNVQMEQLQRQMAQQKVAEERRDAFRASLPEQYRNLPDELLDEYLKASMTPQKPQLVTVQTPNGPVQRWVKPGESNGVDVGAPADKEAALPWYVKKGIDGKTSIDPAYADFEKAKAVAARPATPYFQFLPTADGYAIGNARTGQIAPASLNGNPVVKASDDPTLQGRIAQAKESGKTMGEETTKAALDAPRVVDNATTALRYSNELLKHPGFSQAVGASSMLGIQKIPGTAAKDFMNRLDQLKGGAFLEAFNSLKGGGQITELEGKKATDAIARMDNATSEGEFKQAVKDYQDVIRRGMHRAQMKAKPVGQVQQPTISGIKFLGFEE